MRSAAVCIAFVLTCTSGSLVAGIRYIDPQPGSNGDISDKRLDLAEPSCDQLRAMWRYTKRQSRAAKTTNGYPVYPYNPNIWSRTELPELRTNKFSRGYTRGEDAPYVPFSPKPQRTFAKDFLKTQEFAFVIPRMDRCNFPL